MPDWLERTLLTVVIAIAVLLVLWPTRSSGRRLLRTWGIEEPSDDQATEAVFYLGQRRILYVVLFMALKPTSGLLNLGDLRLPALGIFGPLVAAMLVAELISLWWPVGVLRGATLTPRSWRDLVPNWAVAITAVLVALVVVFAVAAPAPLGDRISGAGYAAVCLVLVGLLVHLAVRRRGAADEAVAMALRTRTARVAVGIGFAWLGAALTAIARAGASSWSATSVYLLLGTVLAWIWIANGTQRVFARGRR
jgi:hypothetical protein